MFRRDRHWVGGDGAYSVDLGAGRVLWLFGDSWIDPTGRASRKSAVMVSNSVAIQHGYDPARAHADFHWGSPDQVEVGPFFPDFDGGKYWPGHGVRLGQVVLLFLMAVRASDAGLGFAVADWTAVLVQNPDDPPPSWRLRWLEAPTSPPGVIVGSGGVLRNDGWVYAFGAQEPGPDHDVYLVRWTEEEAMDGRLDAGEWWTGPEGGWQGPAEGSALPRPVLAGGQTEFTVHFDPEARMYHLVQTDGFGAAALVRRVAPDVTGPWSAKDTLYLPPQGTLPQILIYQGKAHPYLRGGKLVLTYCTNSQDFGDHFTESGLYFPRFVRFGGGQPR